MTLMFVGCIVW